MLCRSVEGFLRGSTPKVPFPILFGTTVTTVLHYRADCDYYRCVRWRQAEIIALANLTKIHILLQVIGPYHFWACVTSCWNAPSCRESPQSWRISVLTRLATAPAGMTRHSPHNVHGEWVQEDAWDQHSHAAHHTTWHTGLLHKLSKCLVFWCVQTVELLLWNCRFQVHMGDDVTYWRRQVNGLPQRSVLALTLFNLYTNNHQSHAVTGLSVTMTLAVLCKQKLSQSNSAPWQPILTALPNILSSGSWNAPRPRLWQVFSTCITTGHVVN